MIKIVSVAMVNGDIIKNKMISLLTGVGVSVGSFDGNGVAGV